MRGGAYDEDELEAQLRHARADEPLPRPLRRSAVTKPWQMYPLGVLFGLGFDTATEVALLFLAAGAAGAGLPWYAILCLPVLFAAGMSLLDTIDGSFMNFAYGWAFSKPVRKVFYNLTITGLSVAVALVIGTIELLSIAVDRLDLSGGFWAWVAGDRPQHARLRRSSGCSSPPGRSRSRVALRAHRGALGGLARARLARGLGPRPAGPTASSREGVAAAGRGGRGRTSVLPRPDGEDRRSTPGAPGPSPSARAERTWSHARADTLPSMRSWPRSAPAPADAARKTGLRKVM